MPTNKENRRCIKKTKIENSKFQIESLDNTVIARYNILKLNIRRKSNGETTDAETKGKAKV